MQFGFDGAAQFCGRGEEKRILFQRFFQSLRVAPRERARGTVVKMFFQFQNARGVQFAVGVKKSIKGLACWQFIGHLRFEIRWRDFVAKAFCARRKARHHRPDGHIGQLGDLFVTESF